MTLQSLVLIFLWSFIVLLLLATFLIIFLLGRHSIRDNPNKALVYVKTGKHISKPLNGKIDGKPTNKGSKYTYGKNIVFVPARYGDYFHRSKRMLFVSHLGQLVASPFSDDIELSGDEKNELIYGLVESHIGADAMRAIKGKSTINILIVAIIAFAIGAIIVFGVTQYQAQSDLKQTNNIQQVEPETPKEKPQEVK